VEPSKEEVKEIPCLLWNLVVHYRVHNSPLLVPILSQTNLVHNLTHYLFQIHFNIILSSTARSYKWYVIFNLPYRV